MKDPYLVWTCKIGQRGFQGEPNDLPMRKAIKEAYNRLGNEPDFCFSGWGGYLQEKELAEVENRHPREIEKDKLLRELTRLIIATPPEILMTSESETLRRVGKAILEGKNVIDRGLPLLLECVVEESPDQPNVFDEK